MRHLLAVGLVVVGMVAFVALSAFVGVSLGTAADSDSSGWNHTSHPVAIGATRFRSDDGYSFLLPAGWSASTIDGVRSELLMNALRASDSSVATLVDRVLNATRGRISVVGGELHLMSSTDWPSNVTVLRQPESTSRAEAVLQVLSVLLRNGGIGGIKTSGATIAERPATRIDWTLNRPPTDDLTASGGATLATYVVQGNDAVLLVTVGRPIGATERQRRLENDIIRSFRLEPLPAH
jgi:hypothetical protein